MFVLGVIVGLIAMFFLGNFGILTPLISGLIAGLVAKGPIAGLIAGMFVALIGFALSASSSITAFTILGDISNLSHVSSVEPISLAKTIFGISGVAAATFGGFIGGFIRR
jgi:hypothetical protein